MRAILLALLLLATPAMAQDAMTAAAIGFYQVYGAQHGGGGIPGPLARSRYAPVLSPRLNARLAEAVAAEARFARKVKGAAPPLIEGDIFSSLFEGATAWKVGACSGDGKTARCPVTLSHVEPNQKPVNWTDILVLANTSAGWKVDDVVYDAGFAFGNTGKLSDMLAMTVAQAP